MRGHDRKQDALYSYVSMEDRIPQDHPLRRMRSMVDELLKGLSPRLSKLYASVGRPSIPPEQLLRALLLQALYTICSERQLMEQLDYNILFRWFVGLSMDDRVWVPTVFTKNRDRLLQGEIATAFLGQVVGLAREQELLSDEHFTVDGTLIEAWASLKSFRKKDAPVQPSGDDPGNPTVNFHGEKRTNQTHHSTTDPDARLYRKGLGKEARLSYMGHALMDNRHGLVVGALLTPATGRAEGEAALAMMKQVRRRAKTLGADKWYDQAPVVSVLRDWGVTPHVAQKWDERYTAIDERTTRHPGYVVSQRKRKLIEQLFGWMKTIGLMRKTRHRGKDRVGWMYVFTAAVFNIVRINNLTTAASIK